MNKDIVGSNKTYNHDTDFALESARHVLGQLLHLEHRWIARKDSRELAEALCAQAIAATGRRDVDFLPFKEALARWTTHYWDVLKRADKAVHLRSEMYRALSKGHYINVASTAKIFHEVLPVREDFTDEYTKIIEFLYLTNPRRGSKEKAAAHRLCTIAEYSCRQY